MYRALAFVLASSVSGAAFAGVDPEATAFVDLESWTVDGPALASFPVDWTTALVSDDLSSQAAGSRPTMSGGSGWWSWSMAASGSGGDLTAIDGRIEASVVGDGFAITMSMPAMPDGSGVHGLGGDFGFRSASGERQSGEIELLLSTGDSLVHQITQANPFAGFWTLNPQVTITGITLRPLGTSTNFLATVDNLHFAYAGVIPAPGAIALLAAAGLVGLRRHR